MKIVSLFPTATEIVSALGLLDNLIGVSYACDYPPEVKSKPVVVKNKKNLVNLKPEEIDEIISSSKDGLYEIDVDFIKRNEPDLVITQGICDVCSLPEMEAYRAVREASKNSKVLSLNIQSFKDILSAILEVGKLTGREKEAEDLVNSMLQKVEEVKEKVKNYRKVKAFCLEWLNPPWSSGHWVPEMVELAGGFDALAQKGKPSRRLTWEEIKDYKPEIVILIPCGFNISRTLKSLSDDIKERLKSLKAEVYATEASSYFNKAGPRVIEGVKILAEIFHKDDFQAPKNSYVKL